MNISGLRWAGGLGNVIYKQEAGVQGGREGCRRPHCDDECPLLLVAWSRVYRRANSLCGLRIPECLVSEWDHLWLNRWGGAKDHGTDVRRRESLRFQNHSSGDLVNCVMILQNQRKLMSFSFRAGWQIEQVGSGGWDRPTNPWGFFYIYNTCMYKYCICIFYCYITRFPDGQCREKQRGGKRRLVRFYIQ